MHENLPPADDLPWTISYVIRKREQVDSFSELPDEKRPPDKIIWDGTSEELNEWFDKVLKRKGKFASMDEFDLQIKEDEIG